MNYHRHPAVHVGQVWTPAMEASLRRLWTAGATSGEIGEQLGVSRGAVTGKARRLDLERRANPLEPNNERFERLIDLVTDGASIEMAARAVVMPLTTAKERWRALCRRMGTQAT
jgi:hypothetical protein